MKKYNMQIGFTWNPRRWCTCHVFGELIDLFKSSWKSLQPKKKARSTPRIAKKLQKYPISVLASTTKLGMAPRLIVSTQNKHECLIMFKFVHRVVSRRF